MPPIQVGGAIVDIRKADVRVIFSTGTDWGLASSDGTFRPSTDTLSIVSCWLYRKYAPGYTILEGLEKGSTRRQERVVG
jgi:hypothetical protein